MMPIGREAAVSGPSKRTVRAAIRLLGEAVRLDRPPTALVPGPYAVHALVRDARCIVDMMRIGARDYPLDRRSTCAIAEQLLMQGWVP